MTLSPQAHAESLVEALPYIQKFRGQTFVIKYGGSAMENEEAVDRLLRDIVFLEAVGINPVLVHGGGKAISAKMREAGLHPQFVHGLRVTDAAAIEIVSSTLDGEINPHIVSTINRFGGRAEGYSGREVFVARKLPPQLQESGPPVDIGFVGEAVEIHAGPVESAIAREVVPVISPIGADARGITLNINADVAAAALAADLRASKLIYLSDVQGIMRDPADLATLIPSVAGGQIDELIKHRIVSGGMIPKLRSAVSALHKGVGKVHMIGGATHHGLLLEIFTNAGVGTEIVH
jgi:acetylglutamate kinase